MNPGQILGLAWTFAAWWFIASVAAAPAFLLVRTLRARGRRKFAEEPTQRVRALRHDTSHLHEMDAL
jgi:uncharacterized membrane protein YdjX (TVP38/TMEM64 family)